MQPEVAVAVFRACVAANLRLVRARVMHLAAAFLVQTAPDVRSNFRKSRIIIQQSIDSGRETIFASREPYTDIADEQSGTRESRVERDSVALQICWGEISLETTDN